MIGKLFYESQRSFDDAISVRHLPKMTFILEEFHLIEQTDCIT